MAMQSYTLKVNAIWIHPIPSILKLDDGVPTIADWKKSAKTNMLFQSSVVEVESQYNILETEFENRQQVAHELGANNDADTEEIFSELKKHFLEFQRKMTAKIEAAGWLKKFPSFSKFCIDLKI